MKRRFLIIASRLSMVAAFWLAGFYCLLLGAYNKNMCMGGLFVKTKCALTVLTLKIGVLNKMG